MEVHWDQAAKERAFLEQTEYVAKKINPILEDMVTAVIMTKPINPIPFMITFLRERSGEA